MSVRAPAPVNRVNAVNAVVSSRCNDRDTADPAHSIALRNPVGGPTAGGLASWMSWQQSRRT